LLIDLLAEGATGSLCKKTEGKFQYVTKCTLNKPLLDAAGEAKAPLADPRRLEQVDCSDGIDVEIVQRNVTCFVVRRLCGAVDDEVEGVRLEEREYARPISDVEVVMDEVPRDTPQARQVPARVTLGAEEYLAHIVIDAVDFPVVRRVVFDSLGPDQTAAPGDQEPSAPQRALPSEVRCTQDSVMSPA